MKETVGAMTESDDETVSKLVGYEEITGHLVFDTRLGENFRRKARCCADGHKTSTPTSMTHSTVVARDSVRTMLLIVALNEIELKGADVKNAFLSSPNKERCWLRAGPEFRALEGKPFVVTAALCGLKSVSASFRAHMAKKFDEMNFKSSHADPDVWRRPAAKANGEKCYECLLTCVDDSLAVSENATATLKDVATTF